MTYYDRLNHFFEFAQERQLKGGVQLVYLHVLHEWNRLRHPADFSLSTREIERRACVPRENVHRALNSLKQLGLLNYEDGKISLPSGGTLAGTAVGQRRDSGNASSLPKNNSFSKTETETRTDAKQDGRGDAVDIAKIREMVKKPKLTPEQKARRAEIVAAAMKQFSLKSLDK